jgi:hypothetical protein
VSQLLDKLFSWYNVLNASGTKMPRRDFIQFTGTLTDDPANNKLIVSTDGAGGGGTASDAVPSPNNATTGAAGSATEYSRGDHRHQVETAAPVNVGSANGAGSASTLSRSDHVHAHGDQAGGTLHAVATTSTAGFMSAADKTKLDGLSGGGATDHGDLAGLSDDDHGQYALLAGRTGGQSLVGGTAAGEHLILQSTSNASRGQVRPADPINLQDQDLLGVKTASFEGINDLGNVSGAFNLDMTDGQFHKITLTGDATATVIAPNGPATHQLEVVQGAGAPHTLQFDFTEVRTPSGGTIDLSQAAGDVDNLSIKYAVSSIDVFPTLNLRPVGLTELQFLQAKIDVDGGEFYSADSGVTGTTSVTAWTPVIGSGNATVPSGANAPALVTATMSGSRNTIQFDESNSEGLGKSFTAIPSSVTEITIAVHLVVANTTANTEYLVSLGRSTSLDHSCSITRNDSSGVKWSSTVGGGTSGTFHRNVGSAQDTSEHVVIISYNRSTKTSKVFVDGVEVTGTDTGNPTDEEFAYDRLGFGFLARSTTSLFSPVDLRKVAYMYTGFSLQDAVTLDAFWRGN